MPRRRRSASHTRNKRPRAHHHISWRAIRKANRRRKPSELETTVHKWLEEDGIPFHKQHRIGRCHVDIFLEPRTIVELHGCHWHGCAICNRKLTDWQRARIRKDGNRYGFFRKRGYDVVIIWECEVEREPERVRAILRLLAKCADSDH